MQPLHAGGARGGGGVVFDATRPGSHFPMFFQRGKVSIKTNVTTRAETRVHACSSTRLARENRKNERDKMPREGKAKRRLLYTLVHVSSDLIRNNRLTFSSCSQRSRQREMKIARIIILFVVEEEGERDTFFYLKKGIIGVLSLSRNRRSRIHLGIRRCVSVAAD